MKLWTTALVVSSIAAAAAFQEPAGQAPRPLRFEARADLILIDATIVDNDGAPVADLTADDFLVSVDGTPRAIASLQFVRSAPTAAPAAGEARPTHYSTNEGASDGRRIMIAVDENSIPPGGARAVLTSIERLLNDLSPADRVSFLRLPQFQGGVDFTTDRERVLAAVKTTVGKARRLGPSPVTLSEAVAYEKRDTFQWQRALTRLCSGSAPPRGQSARLPTGGGSVAFDPADEFDFCRQNAENRAAETITTYQNRARETVDALSRLVTNLELVPGSKTLVLLSQGFLSHDLRHEITRIADAAAAARVSLYGLYIDMQGMDVDTAEASFTRSEDELLMADGIDALVGASRGARFRIVGTGQNVFARVARELSGYYLIGLEPTDGDRDGRPHRIKVEVKRRSTTVRARAQFTIASAAAAGASAAAPAAQLLETLRRAAPEPGVPLRVTAFAAPSAASASHVKVIVGADVGPPIASPVELHVGYVLVDRDGKVAADQFLTVVLRPRGAREASVPRFVGFAEVPPGEYMIRFAVVDADGRTGSVHHPVDARLKTVAGLSVSDLMLAPPEAGGSVQPEVHVNLEGEALQALVELATADAARLTEARVSFEVSHHADGAPLVSQRAVLAGGAGPLTAAAVTLDVGGLPPGDYVARAIVEVRGEKPLITTRPFQVAPRRRAAAADRERSPAAAVAGGRARPPIPPFKPEDVLAPVVVNPFIDHVLASYSPSPAGREALSAIKAGNLKNAAKGNREMGDVALSFAQGLSMLSERRIPEAAAYFRAALRKESEFIGAAFYLGATLAASGKDRDAVGAWQTALISDIGAAGVYPVLIDGLLRLGEGEQALDLLGEAEPTFSDRDEHTRRLVQAYALIGRHTEALPLAYQYLGAHTADLDMLFLTMHMIYEAHASGELAEPAAELERFDAYAARYTAAHGPQALMVQGWRKAMGIR